MSFLVAGMAKTDISLWQDKTEAQRSGFGLEGEEQQNKRDELCNETKKLVASDMTLATSWKGRLKSIFEMRVMGRTRKRKSPNRPSGRRRQCAVRAFCRRQNLGAGGIHFRRAFESPQGGAALWAAEPTKQDTT